MNKNGTEIRNAHRLFVGKREWKSLFGIQMRRQDDTIRMDLQEIELKHSNQSFSTFED